MSEPLRTQQNQQKPRACVGSHPVSFVHSSGGLLLFGGGASTVPYARDNGKSPSFDEFDCVLDLRMASSTGWTGIRSNCPNVFYQMRWPLVFHIPTPNGSAPPIGVHGIQRILDWLVRDRRELVLVMCDAGHGRTGAMLAAILHVLGEENAVNIVRNSYCAEAIETRQQITWLREIGCDVRGVEPSMPYSLPFGMLDW